MSEISTLATRKADRRVTRTRNALGDALIALMQEKPFEAITVQDILDRANISRSTFYSHYRDSEDLFMSEMEDFFQRMSTLLPRRGEDSNRIVPVRELFMHFGSMTDLYNSLIASGKIADVSELGIGIFARSIEQHLTRLRPGTDPTTAAATAHALAGALFSMTTWWMTRGTPTSPEKMDQVFHQLAWSQLAHS